MSTWKIIGIVIGFIILIIFLNAMGWICEQSGVVTNDPFGNYEEYQTIYNTCIKINDDLGAIRKFPEDDKMFSQFSQQALILGKQQTMNRWIQEYNAKSKMWNRALWKSKALPYQLSTDDFNNYSGE